MKAPLYIQVNQQNGWELANSHETGRQDDDGVDDSHDPFVAPFPSQAELLREGQVGPVGSRLIPSLRGGSAGAHGDGIPKHGRAVPLVVPLVDERPSLIYIKLGYHLGSAGVSCHESSSPEPSGVLGHPMRLGKSPRCHYRLFRGSALRKTRGSTTVTMARERSDKDAPAEGSQQC